MSTKYTVEFIFIHKMIKNKTHICQDIIEISLQRELMNF